MKCLAISFGLVKYDWNKRDGILPQTALKSYAQNVLFNLPGDVYSLTMSNVQPSDEGWYCCVATNEGGNTSHCAWLEVNSKLHYLPQLNIQLYDSRIPHNGKLAQQKTFANFPFKRPFTNVF